MRQGKKKEKEIWEHEEGKILAHLGAFYYMRRETTVSLATLL